LFARAPFSAAGWDTALHALASATGSSRAQLVAMGERHTLFNWVTDIDEGYVDEFIAIEAFRPEVNYRVAATAPPFVLQWEDHYDAIRARATNEVYIDHVRRWDAEDGAQMVLADDADAFFGLAALHAASDGRTTEAQRAVLLAAAPSVLSAIRVQQAIEHEGAALLRGSLEALRSAAVLIDGRGRVAAVTPAAEPLLGPDTLQVRGGRLRAARADIDRRLSNRLAAALTRNAAPCEFWLQGSRGPMRIEVCALPHQDWGFGFAPRAIVTLKVPAGLSGHQAPRLGEALELTTAEGEIVALLVQGHSRQAIARMRGVSVQTVSSQLRAIFLKAGVNREAELVSIARAVIEMAG